ncbi:hypothetical protein JKF63_02840 [Porcisia hertigi]|uniref:Sulfhydryl oxidase n=1 Tax=Porcisia hertigi TaxID=2761500 RepID=A0A836HSY5_9TRYP|nr:hypothetical protein JKF63_02840 [Porcisia hertigi]
MALRRRCAPLAVSLLAFAVLCCSGVVAFFFESRSLFPDSFEVVDISSTALSELHEWSHLCPWILLAYSSGCGHCRASAPLVSRIAKETFENSGDVLNEVTVAALNCETHLDVCRGLGVNSVPSFYLLLPSTINISDATLSPIVANKKKIDESASRANPITMARVAIGPGSRQHGHFDTARSVWGGLSTNVWSATHKERCLYMRNYLRNLKQSTSAEIRTGEASPADGAGGFVEDTTFHAVDVANAFFETLYHEVALMGLESASGRQALLNFLRAVEQRLPGLGADVLLQALTAYNEVNETRYSSTASAFMSVGEWQSLVLSAGIPYQGTPRNLRWQTCKGSSWRYRGFPCGMWLLYHALTANMPDAGTGGVPTTPVSRDQDGAEVLHVVLNYARSFFACGACRTHFLRFQPDHTDPALQLWRFHNEVNLRLAKVEEGADPLVPKRVFPSIEECPTCFQGTVAQSGEDLFVLTNVSIYLRSRYKWNSSSLYKAAAGATSTTREVATNSRYPDVATEGPDPPSLDMLPRIIIIVAVLGVMCTLWCSPSSSTKRRRPILPLRPCS